MSDSRRLEGERVFCHQCDNEWDRANGGLTCPRCEGEFTEILPAGGRQRSESPAEPPPPIPRHPLADHNPWEDEAPDPAEGDISTFEFSTPGGGRGTFSYTSRTFTTNNAGPRNMMGGFPFSPFGFGDQNGGFGGQNMNGGFTTRASIFPRDPRAQPGPQPGDMQDLLSMVFQTMQQAQPRRPQGQGAPTPFDLLGAIMNPGTNGRMGDAVWSQEAFDRILEQLAEQNGQSTAPGPAAESAIKSLETKKVKKEMMGSDGTAECSICMDAVEIGADVTVLPCTHWFHGDCVIAWLKEHDTCPHCRKSITKPEDQAPGASRRRSSRSSSSVASPYGGDGTRDRPFQILDSPTALREQRNSYYTSRRDAEERPDQPRRHSSHRHDRHSNSRQNSSGGGSGGVTGWIRNHMGFGGG